MYVLNKASAAQIADHLLHCDADFVPPLSGRVEINDYARKIVSKATRFEAWSGSTLVGLVAAYCNDQENRIAYISSVSVLRAWTGKGIASRLMSQCIEHAKASGMRQIGLEVAGDNTPAIKLYEKGGFEISNIGDPSITMNLYLEAGKNMNSKRDYNVEINDTNDHKYAYGFDFDVMHPYMIKSFEPFFNKGSLLELGSFKGDFTKQFLPYFADVTCVEASDVAIVEAKKKLGDKVKFVNSLIEKTTLPKRYDNIVLTHVLEHMDDPVLVLKRINKEWLAENGRLFLVCPNANAPSRQIAVKMGLITHNSAVTPAEAEQGHRCTYTLNTLERDAVAAGLKVVYRSGIFFKALANFQWDRLLNTDIISKEYLEGCYKLGQQYPDLCSSIFLMCERGDV
jgi:ribosomal protein S18 acetylase RimI-like enzyme/2-polyprenyl-3-methyl-5-hydroxy-6-metoxy-1,4-benzoquinol methylase